MRSLVPAVVALVPLVILPGVVSYFDITPKIAILLFAAALAMLTPLQNAANLRSLLANRPGRWFAALIAAEWVASAIATAVSTNRSLSLDGGNWRRFGLLSETGLLVFALVAAAWMAANPRRIRTLLWVATASGALASVYGIGQYFGWDPFLPATAYQVGEGRFTIVRPPGTLGHADYFAAWLVMVAFFGVTLSRSEEFRWQRIAAGTVPALAAVAIVLSGTRAAMLGLLAGAAVFCFFVSPRMRLRAAVLAMAGAACLAVFFFSPAGTKLRARLHWSLEDRLGGARLMLWRDSLRMAVHRPIAGFGPETFGTDFPRYQSIELARAYPDFYHESPHNMFLDALTARGILGLAALLGFCGLGLWAATRKFEYRGGLAAALAGTLVAQQFAVFIAPTALYFYLLIAMLAVAAAGEAPVTAVNERRAWEKLVPVFGLAIGLVLAIFAVRLVQADRKLAVAYRRIEAGDVGGAAQVYKEVLRWQPAGASADLAYSRAMEQLAVRSTIFLTRIEAHQQAVEAGVRAVITAEDRQNAWYNLATLFAGDNDAAKVEKCLRNAIAWAPNWFKPHWALAKLLAVAGRRAEALPEAAAAVERDGGHDPEVLETLTLLQQRR